MTEKQLDLTKGNSAVITWEQAVAGTVTVFVCDLDGNIVRHLIKKASQSAGGNQAAWDGKDDDGKNCPTGAYVPIIKINTPGKGTAIFNPSTSAWGKEIPETPISYDPATKLVSYTIEEVGMYLIRVGEADGGPFYKTLLNFEPRTPGDYTLKWDGMDVSGVVKAWEREKFEVVIQGFTLPENAIILRGSKPPGIKRNTQYKKFPLHPPRATMGYIHTGHPRYVCRDFTIIAKLIKPAGRYKDLPVLGKRTQIQIDTGPDLNLPHIEKETFEVYVSLDGQFVSETTVKSLPVDIDLGGKKFAPGAHFVTVNVRTLEDHVGSASIKVWIR